jgi:hypothetical protein
MNVLYDLDPYITSFTNKLNVAIPAQSYKRIWGIIPAALSANVTALDGRSIGANIPCIDVSGIEGGAG